MEMEMACIALSFPCMVCIGNGMVWYGIVSYALVLAMEMEMVWYDMHYHFQCPCIPYHTIVIAIAMPMNTIPYHTIANAYHTRKWQGNAYHCHCQGIPYHTISYYCQCIPYNAYNGMHWKWYGMVCIGIGNGNGNGMVCIGNRNGMHWKWKWKWYALVWYALELAMEMAMLWYALEITMVCYGIGNVMVWYALAMSMAMEMVCSGNFNGVHWQWNGMAWYGMVCISIGNGNVNGMICISIGNGNGNDMVWCGLVCYGMV
jgi:hypothetical protein